jgi:hypothetical protein
MDGCVARHGGQTVRNGYHGGFALVCGVVEGSKMIDGPYSMQLAHSRCLNIRPPP